MARLQASSSYPEARRSLIPLSLHGVFAQYLRNPISTICMGQAASMASLLLAAGEPGQRRSLPNTRIMLHQPSGGASVRDRFTPFKDVFWHLKVQGGEAGALFVASVNCQMT